MNVLPSAPAYDVAQPLYPTHELAQLNAEDFRLKKINDLLKELSDEAEHYRQVAKKYKRTHSLAYQWALTAHLCWLICSSTPSSMISR